MLRSSGFTRKITARTVWVLVKPVAAWHSITIMLLELEHAEIQRRHWRSVIAQEVFSEPALLSFVPVCDSQ